MREMLGRINLCFSKIKRIAFSEPSSSSPSGHRRPPPESAAGAACVLVKNFNSLFDLTCNTKSLLLSGDDDISDSDSDLATGNGASTPDLATVFASQRFFFSSPGRSNSIVESSSPSTSSPSFDGPSEPDASADSGVGGGGGVAVPTYSPDPYADFRLSMQEMVEAQQLFDVRSNWDHLHELLTCYLALNPKSTHKFIVRAFADLLVTLMTSPPATATGRPESDFSGSEYSF
ncbi:hypothetical protein NMG60_11013993 [Bertholletia excelsa]